MSETKKQGTTLASLSLGEKGIVTSLDCGGIVRRRFLDLGLIPGTSVEVALKSPINDPVAYVIRGSVIALRCEEAGQVQVRKED